MGDAAPEPQSGGSCLVDEFDGERKRRLTRTWTALQGRGCPLDACSSALTELREEGEGGGAEGSVWRVPSLGPPGVSRSPDADQAGGTSMSSGMPCGASVSGASGPPGLAATGMMGAPRNLEQKDKSHHGHRRARWEVSALTPSKAPRGAA